MRKKGKIKGKIKRKKRNKEIKKWKWKNKNMYKCINVYMVIKSIKKYKK